MPFTRGAREVPNQTPASTSDARKRLGDALDAFRDGLSEAVENMDTSTVDAFLQAGYKAFHAPPPVEPAPWSAISEDRERPTLARVTYTVYAVQGKVDRRSQTARVYRSKGTVFDEWDDAVADLEQVVSVELVHTYDPETERVVPIKDER